MKKKKIRSIAIVLPQFHPIPENDEWWGKGFTEWTNVTKAKPLFKGHYQPRLPTDLGFYDLRLKKSRKAQADLAKEYGIYGFCYYHYWFNGKRLLNTPLDDMLKEKEPSMPFMYCWANENWTRRWDGLDKEILIKQNYNFEDDESHIRWLCKNVFNDERYIRINDSPVFLIYRQDLIPDVIKTVSIWRRIAKEEFGYNDLYLCATHSFNNEIDPRKINFNAAIEFSPHLVLNHKISKRSIENLLIKLKLRKNRNINFKDYNLAVEKSIEKVNPHYILYRSVTPGFDNTARKGNNGVIAVGSSPQTYYRWLVNILQNFEPPSEEENFVFINAMNEWAEGNHLEPCSKYGREYLEMTKKALENF